LRSSSNWQTSLAAVDTSRGDAVRAVRRRTSCFAAADAVAALLLQGRAAQHEEAEQEGCRVGGGGGGGHAVGGQHCLPPGRQSYSQADVEGSPLLFAFFPLSTIVMPRVGWMRGKDALFCEGKGTSGSSKSDFLGLRLV
jgi:hypothetical protein